MLQPVDETQPIAGAVKKKLVPGAALDAPSAAPPPDGGALGAVSSVVNKAVGTPQSATSGGVLGAATAAVNRAVGSPPPNPGGTPVGAAMPDAPPAPLPAPIPAVGSSAPPSTGETAIQKLANGSGDFGPVIDPFTGHDISGFNHPPNVGQFAPPSGPSAPPLSYQGTAPDPQGIAYGGATPAPTTSPLTGMTEGQRNEFWAQRFNDAGQTGVVLPAGTPSTGVGSNGVNTYNPATLTSQQNTLAAAGASDPAIQAAMAQTATNQLPTPLADNDPGYQQFVKDQNVKAAMSVPGNSDPQGVNGAGPGMGPVAGTPTAPVVPSAPNSSFSPAGSSAPIPAVGASANATLPSQPSGAQPSPGTGNVSQFTADNNLVGSQINPQNSAELTNLNGLVGNAANAVGKGESRGDIAKGYLDAFDTAAQPQIRDQIRAVGQRASALGRLGMGDTAVEALNPYTDYLTQRSALEKTLASDSASGDISDRLNNLGALSGVQNTTNSQEANARNELRGERGYQYQTSEQAVQDALQQFLAGQQAQNQQFNQGLQIANASSPYGQNAAQGFDALASFLAPYLQPKPAGG